MRRWVSLVTACSASVLFAHTAEAGPAVQVTVGTLNVRTGPSTGNAKIGALSNGQIYAELSRSGSWVKLQFDGRQAWSYAPYTKRLERTIHRVTASALNVRSGPSTGYRVLGQLPRDARVATVGSSGSWRKLYFQGRTAWAHQNYLAVLSGAPAPAPAPTPTPAPTGTTYYVTASSLNVRSGPGTTHGVIGSLGRGAKVTSYGTSGSWHTIGFGSGRGWVHGSYLSRTAPGASTSGAGFVNLPASGEGFYSYQGSSRRWGTPTLIYGIQRAARRYIREQAGRPRLGTGDISKAGGGYFPPHVSHRYGKDLDARPMRNDGREAPVLHTYGSYSRTLTRRVLDFLKSELPEKLILFNDTAIPGVRWYSGHSNHFHFRIH